MGLPAAPRGRGRRRRSGAPPACAVRRGAGGDRMALLAERDLARAIVAAGGVEGIAQRPQDAVGERAGAVGPRLGGCAALVVFHGSSPRCLNSMFPRAAAAAQTGTLSNRSRVRPSSIRSPSASSARDQLLAVDAQAVAVLAAQVGDDERFLGRVLDDRVVAMHRRIGQADVVLPVPADADHLSRQRHRLGVPEAEPRLVRPQRRGGVSRFAGCIGDAGSGLRGETRGALPLPARPRLHEIGGERDRRQQQHGRKRPRSAAALSCSPRRRARSCARPRQRSLRSNAARRSTRLCSGMPREKCAPAPARSRRGRATSLRAGCREGDGNEHGRNVRWLHFQPF